MKQSLQMKMGQSLTMTPQLQQAIRLLQLSTLDLQSEIQEALESNPMLEESAEIETSDAAQTEKITEPNSKEPPEDLSKNPEITPSEASTTDNAGDVEWNEDIPSDLAVETSWDDIYQTSSASTGPARTDEDDIDYESRRGTTESLQDHIEWQLNLTPMSDEDLLIAEAIVDAIAPSGMLNSPIDDIFQGLQAHNEELEIDEVTAVLHRIQQFDPPGIAAQDLSECLHIQLRQLEKEQNVTLEVPRKIVQNHLDLLAVRDFKQLMRKLRVKEAELQEAIVIIQALNPKPGEGIGIDSTEYVVPDVFVSKQNDVWTVKLNPEISPKLRINSGYASMVKRADSSSDNTFLRDNLQEARWFLKSLQSRNETLLKVSTCIVEKQQGFLDQGPEAMRPMVLHDIAEAVEMHESTISRVTTQKYMHTPQGIFELKYFFSSHVATAAGGECSSTAIRAIIKKLVAAENTRKPLSDSKITTLLAEQGIKVARRTIAKYRESLNIPPSNERKQLI